jgi:hypothetical protein
MKLSNEINATIYDNSPAMLAKYLEANGIKGAFVEKDGREFVTYEGDPEERCGFVAGRFTLLREAKALASKINDLIVESRVAKINEILKAN